MKKFKYYLNTTLAFLIVFGGIGTVIFGIYWFKFWIWRQIHPGILAWLFIFDSK